MTAPTLPTPTPGGLPLRDIQSLDAVPWWPPAPGWWALAAALLLFALALRYVRPRLRPWRLPIRTLGGWRRAAVRELRALRRRAADRPAKVTAGELSELLRRIAMARLGRAACAGLTGADWLRWLAAHDPHGFDWTQHGVLLLATPYAPPEPPANEATTATLLTLIDAATAWAEARPTRNRFAPAREGAARV